MKKINKKTINKFGEHYLLGVDADGVKHYLKKPSFDCGWYWGFGYIHTFTNNNKPELSRDISRHYHFNSFEKNSDMFDGIKKAFISFVLDDDELWKLCELMKTAYILRDYSDTLNRGGANYTANPCREIIKNDDEYNRINKTVLPAIFEQVKKLLTEN